MYAYTTETTLGTPVSTITYGYTNSSWGDQLTSYNGQSITYDAMGNPINYLGSTMVWEGKQLASSATNGTTSAYAYDENGIRTRKTVGNTVYDYYYCGRLLLGIIKETTNADGTTTTSRLRFGYDATARGSIFYRLSGGGNVLGVNYNGTYYYYIRNAQNDG